MPGNALTAPGNYSPTVTLPPTGDGAPVIITQSIGAFCGGACNGATTTVEPFDGYNDPANPVQLTLRSWFVPGGPDTDPDPLTAAAIAFSNQLYVHNNAGGPTDGALMPHCVTPPRAAGDYPCAAGKTIQQPTPNNFVVTFNVLYLSARSPSAADRTLERRHLRVAPLAKNVVDEFLQSAGVHRASLRTSGCRGDASAGRRSETALRPTGIADDQSCREQAFRCHAEHVGDELQFVDAEFHAAAQPFVQGLLRPAARFGDLLQRHAAITRNGSNVLTNATLHFNADVY